MSQSKSMTRTRRNHGIHLGVWQGENVTAMRDPATGWFEVSIGQSAAFMARTLPEAQQTLLQLQEGARDLRREIERERRSGKRREERDRDFCSPLE